VASEAENAVVRESPESSNSGSARSESAECMAQEVSHEVCTLPMTFIAADSNTWPNRRPSRQDSQPTVDPWPTTQEYLGTLIGLLCVLVLGLAAGETSAQEYDAEGEAFCYVKLLEVPVFESPGGREVALLYRALTLPQRADSCGHMPVRIVGWCRMSCLAPDEGMRSSGNTRIDSPCPLWDWPRCPTWGSGGLGLELGVLVSGGSLVADDHECGNTRVTVEGWVPLEGLTSDPSEIVKPEEFKTLDVICENDSCLFVGLIRNPHPEVDIDDWAARRRLILFDRGGNMVLTHSFSLGNWRGSAQAPSQATDDPTWLKFKQSLPMACEEFATYRLARPAGGLIAVFR